MLLRRGLAASAALALVVAGCGSQSTANNGEQPSTTSPGSAPTATPAPPTQSPSVDLQPLAERCGLTAAQTGTTTVSAITATTKERLYSASAGGGRLGVVLVHGSGSRGVCNWAQEIAWLGKAGLNVVGYDQSCIGNSTCAGDSRPVDDLLSVVAELRRRGAAKVAVVGASAGGSLPLVAAARPNSGISSVVSLSTAGLTQPLGTADAPDAVATSLAPTLRVPVLYVLAEDDSASSVAEISSIKAATKGSRLALLPPGSGHAQQVLYDKSGQRPSAFRQTFLTFLRTAG